MTETITIRVYGTDPVTIIGSKLQCDLTLCYLRQISDNIFEIKLPLRSDSVRLLFQLHNESRKRDGGWFISFYAIKREYAPSELTESTVIHVLPRRVFSEPISEPSWFELAGDAGCEYPIRQIGPVILNRKIKCKDDLLMLSDGSWLCRPTLYSEMVKYDLELPTAFPVFESAKKSEQWMMLYPEVFLEPSSGNNSKWIDKIDDPSNSWFQLKFRIGSCTIVPPTDARAEPYLDDDPRSVCSSPKIYGSSLISELFVVCAEEVVGDLCVTSNLIGNSNGAYLPSAELLISQRAYHVLKTARTHNLEFNRVHIHEDIQQ